MGFCCLMDYVLLGVGQRSSGVVFICSPVDIHKCRLIAISGIMSKSVTKYIPSEMRLEIAQEVVREKGIRPLARKLDVNPKSVYKYKNGEAYPGDDVMDKLLEIADSDSEITLNDYMDSLREDFLSALDQSFEFSEGTGEESSTVGQQTHEEGGTEPSEGSESTDESEKDVDGESTKYSLSEIYEEIDVTSPFNQTKVEKLIGALKELENPKIVGLIEGSNLSREAVEKYLEKLGSVDLVEEDEQGVYSLKAKVEED